MSEWSARRARLSHDLLKNHFLQCLARLMRAVDGRVVGEGILAECIADLAGARVALIEEGEELLKAALFEVGPVRWFARVPLLNLELQEREWMLAVLSEDWQLRSDFRATLKSSKEALEELGELTQEVLSVVEWGVSGNQVSSHCTLGEQVRAQAEAMFGIVIKLSAHLSRLDEGDALIALAEMDKKVPLK